MQRAGGTAPVPDREQPREMQKMQMRKQEMSPCRVSCHLCQIGLADIVVVGAGGVAVEAGGEVVAEKPELSLGDTSQTWGWPEGEKHSGDKSEQAPAESTGR